VAYDVPEIKLTKGEQKRDFIFIDDIINAFLILFRCPDEQLSFNELDIGTGKQISIKEFIVTLVSIIEKIQNKTIKTKLSFGALSYRPLEKMYVSENVSKLKALGWKPMVDLEEGLTRTIKTII